MLEKLTQYNLSIAHLKNGTHNFEYVVDNVFFSHFEHPELQKGKVGVQLVVEKSERLIVLTFSLKGEIELLCDRTLEAFTYPIQAEEQLLVKYGEEELTLSDEAIQITNSTQEIVLAQHLFEFVAFAIPMKKLHPRFEGELTDEGEGFMVYSSSVSEKKEEPKADARWAALQKLKKNKDNK